MYIKMLLNIKYKYRNMLFNIRYKFRNTSPFDMCMYMYIKYIIFPFWKRKRIKILAFSWKFFKFSKALALQLLARQATGPRKARGAIESTYVDDGKSMLVATFTEILKKMWGAKKPKRCSFFSWFFVFFGEAENLVVVWNHKVDDFLRETVDTMNQLILQHENVSTWQT